MDKTTVSIEISQYNIQASLPDELFVDLARWMIDELRLRIRSLHIIFTDNETLRQMHRDYLNDDTYTDVITFDLGDEEGIEGEIYISLNQAKEQARTYQVSELEEVVRLIIHGILHLAGYEDHLPELRQKMKIEEDKFVRSAMEQFFSDLSDLYVQPTEEA